MPLLLITFLHDALQVLWCFSHATDREIFWRRAEVKSSISLDSLKFKKGPLEKNMVGLVTSVSHDGVVKVDYGFNPKNEMSLLLSELQPVYTDKGHWKNASIQCGQPVRVKDGISEPSTNWGNIRKGATYPHPFSLTTIRSPCHSSSKFHPCSSLVHDLDHCSPLT